MERALDTECGSAPRYFAALRALRDSFRLFWALADRYAKRRLLWVIVLACAAALTTALTPVSLKLAIDSFDTANGAAQYGPVALISLYVLGQYITRCLNELHFFAHGQAQGRLERNLGLRLFDHLLRLPMRFHLERRTGAMGQIAEQGIGACEQLLHQTIFTLLQVTLQFASVAIVLLHFGYPVYFGILAAAAVGYIVVYERGARDIQEPAHAMSTARIDAQAAMTDNLLNAEAIKCYDAESVVSHRYDTDLARVESAWRAFARQRLITGIGVGTVFALSVGASLIYAAYGVTQRTMTIGDFVLVNSYILQFVTPLELLGFALREIVRALANLHGLFGVLGEKTEADVPAARDRSAADCCGELVFSNVTFSYRPDRMVLSNVSFHVPAGRTLAVVGVSGSGKSSLIRLLFRLYEPDSGEIILDGVPISQLSLSTVRQAIAVVPQDTVLFRDTIAANIAFGRHGAVQADIEEAARIANLHDFIRHQPSGYETVVGERGLKLSGGERQRVAIARAALKRPRVFVFDEATSSLDSRTEREILRNLNEVSSHSTTLVIAHRLSTVVHADEIVVLHEGTIMERGAHAHLLALNGQYAALWRAQQSTALRHERQVLST
jgi:ABC-type transport system involved in Fe-S cluster assembly fused permease/ATPase subunit